MSNGSGGDHRRPAGAWVEPGELGPTTGFSLGHDAADRLAAAFGLLADPTRLRILHALACSSEVHVEGLTRLLGLRQSTVSRQLRILRDRAIVGRRREGRLTYYWLDDGSLRRVLCGSHDAASELAALLGQSIPTRREVSEP